MVRALSMCHEQGHVVAPGLVTGSLDGVCKLPVPMSSIEQELCWSFQNCHKSIQGDHYLVPVMRS